MDILFALVVLGVGFVALSFFLTRFMKQITDLFNREPPKQPPVVPGTKFFDPPADPQTPSERDDSKGQK